MNQLNLAATFAATTVLTFFSLTFLFFGDRPFAPPMKAEQAAYVARQTENFGGMFGVRGPHSLRASAERKLMPRLYGNAAPDYLAQEYFVPVSATWR